MEIPADSNMAAEEVVMEMVEAEEEDSADSAMDLVVVADTQVEVVEGNVTFLIPSASSVGKPAM